MHALLYLWQMLRPLHLSLLEILLLIFTSTLVVSGIVISHIDVLWFEDIYAAEDGFVENWTLIPLLIAAVFAFYNLRKLAAQRDWRFKAAMLCSIVFSVFVAGEEISWGQRIFNVESSAFFKENNAQAETNLHNMMIGDKKVNKIVFSQLLTIALAFYLLLLPLLHRKYAGVRAVVNQWGIPIAQRYQVVSCLLLFVSILLIPSGKNSEILEAGITTLFLLIFLFPRNRESFTLHGAD